MDRVIIPSLAERPTETTPGMLLRDVVATPVYESQSPPPGTSPEEESSVSTQNEPKEANVRQMEGTVKHRRTSPRKPMPKSDTEDHPNFVEMITAGITAEKNPAGSTRSYLKTFVHKTFHVDYASIDANFNEAVKIGKKGLHFMFMNSNNTRLALMREHAKETPKKVRVSPRTQAALKAKNNAAVAANPHMTRSIRRKGIIESRVSTAVKSGGAKGMAKRPSVVTMGVAKIKNANVQQPQRKGSNKRKVNQQADGELAKVEDGKDAQPALGIVASTRKRRSATVH
ncbi:hypothetical protein BG011_006890 [Mortierella polycephala]|uniref:Histone H1 n=1 Tax=Mortierella polycephala TaxID=41804 RepID=A0A9P6QFJ3_9FUNG|nr:hypothetical protein BG011_006890 [Mortierella polycephala]